MDNTETLVKRLCRYEGIITSTSVDQVALRGGSLSLREVVDHPGGVTVIPVDDNGDVWCVRQYRYPMGESLLETPAGKLEPEEDPLECGIRELSEETGISASEYIYLGAVYPSPGFCRETLYIYLARGLSFGESHPDENEFLDIEKHSLDELFDLVMRNELADAKTVIAVLKAKAWLEGRKKQP